MSLFTKVRGLRPKRHLHNLSHDCLISHDMGQIVPCFLMEHALPGSKLSISYSQLSRFQALIALIMSNVDSYVRFYKVPFRLLDHEWTRFISGEAETNSNFEYNPPYFTIQGIDYYCNLNDYNLNQFFGPGTLMDFLNYTWTGGTTTSSGYTKKQNIRALQAYLFIVKTWFINENIVPNSSDLDNLISYINTLVPDAYEVADYSYPTGDVSELVFNILESLYLINSSLCFPHAWGKDYFTSALPFVQVGEPVRLSMADTAPVENINQRNAYINPWNATGVYGIQTQHDQEVTDPAFVKTDQDGYLAVNDGSHEAEISSLQANINFDFRAASGGEPYVDLSDATAISILELRIANALQSYKELTARIGHRYNEYLKGTWNVDSRDARLQLPERLGGGKIPVNIADIEQTSATAANQTAATDKTPLGWLAGKATAFGAKMAPIKTFIEEDCLIIGLLYTQPKSRNYCLQGINRFKTKLDDRFDFFHPKFEHIGEQAIMTTELFAGAPKDEVFGYQARYAEYKWWPNEVHGQFNSTLDFWHLARKFSSKPTLSPEFIYVQQSEMSRPFAVQSIEGQSLQQCMSWLHFNVAYLAPMSKYGTPMLLN